MVYTTTLQHDCTRLVKKCFLSPKHVLTKAFFSIFLFKLLLFSTLQVLLQANKQLCFKQELLLILIKNTTTEQLTEYTDIHELQALVGVSLCVYWVLMPYGKIFHRWCKDTWILLTKTKPGMLQRQASISLECFVKALFSSPGIYLKGWEHLQVADHTNNTLFSTFMA